MGHNIIIMLSPMFVATNSIIIITVALLWIAMVLREGMAEDDDVDEYDVLDSAW